MLFRILGSIEASTDGRPAGLGGPKQRALLATLLMSRGAVVSRGRLVEMLWSGDPPASAIQSLQVYVHGLRRVLGADRIETVGAGYRVRLENGELDLDRFEGHLGRGRRALETGDHVEAADELREALTLWRGPALADLPNDIPVAGESERLEELHLEAVELRNDAELACGRHDAIAAELESLVAEHPYRERFREQQILALYRAGRQKDALDAYRDARQVLVEELGLEPSRRLQDLERAILRQEPALAAPRAEPRTKRALPVPPTPLVGRRLEVAAIVGLFRDEEARLVTLTGPGGTGKTRLAMAVAAELENDLRDGALFVDFAPVADPELLLSVIAEALGLQEGTQPLRETVAQNLQARRILLVLDNLEQLIPATTAIADLLGAAPRLLVLATSRAPLRLSGEHEYPVPPLPAPDERLPFEELVRTDAVRLFTARARAVNRSFALTEDTARNVGRICHRLDGLPLAIELAAARAKLLGPAEMLERLERKPQLLGTGPRDAPARQRTLAATIQWSTDLLGEPERAAFASLAVFAGGFTVEAAEQVCGVELDVLASLVDNSLVQQDAATGRFTMLETVRSYALDRLQELDADGVRTRHAEWVTGLAETAEAEMLAGGDTVAWLDRLQAEHDNIRAALGWTIGAAAEELALRLASSLRIFWEVRGHFSEGARWLEQALAIDGADLPGVRAKALSVAGTAAFRRGNLDHARECYEEMLALWRRIDDAEGIARGLSDLGTVAAGVGDLETAVELLEESAERFRELDEPKRLAIVLQNLGHVAGERNDYAGAIAVTEEALALQRDLGYKPNEAISLYNLGSFLLKAGEPERALPELRAAVTLTFELGYKEVAAYAISAVVRIRLLEDDPTGAAELAGVADGLLADAGVSLQTHEQALFDADKERARELLGDAAYEAAHTRGREAQLGDALHGAGLLVDQGR